jgi:hypothetical protein
MSSSDLGVDRRIETTVLDMKENFYQAMYSRRHGRKCDDVKLDKSGGALIEILSIADDTMQRDLASGNPLVAGRALVELRRSLVFLVKTGGHSQFASLVSAIDAGLDRLAQDARRCLIRQVLSPSTPPSEVLEITAALNEMAGSGAWPTLVEDIRAEVRSMESWIGAKRCHQSH